MVLEEGSFGQTDILHEVQVTYQKKQSRDTLRIRDSQTASKEALFPLCFMNHSSLTQTLQSQWCIKYLNSVDEFVCVICWIHTESLFETP